MSESEKAAHFAQKSSQVVKAAGVLLRMYALADANETLPSASSKDEFNLEAFKKFVRDAPEGDKKYVLPWYNFLFIDTVVPFMLNVAVKTLNMTYWVKAMNLQPLCAQFMAAPIIT